MVEPWFFGSFYHMVNHGKTMALLVGEFLEKVGKIEQKQEQNEAFIFSDILLLAIHYSQISMVCFYGHWPAEKPAAWG